MQIFKMYKYEKPVTLLDKSYYLKDSGKFLPQTDHINRCIFNSYILR